MDRYWNANVAASAPPVPASNPGGYPSDGDASTGVDGTVPGAWWYHLVTEELRNAIVALGGKPDYAKTDQLGTSLASSIDGAASALAAPGGGALVGFIQAAPGAVPRDVLNKLRDPLPDIRDWDTTVGLGHDDTATLERAMSDMPPGLQFGPTLKISLSRRINIPASGFRLTGNGASVVQTGTGENSYCFYATGLTDLEIAGFALTPGSGATTTRHGFAILLDACARFSIARCRVTGHLTGGLAAQGCTDGVIVENMIHDALTPSSGPFTNVSGYDIALFNGASRIIVAGNRIHNGCSIGVGVQSYTKGASFTFEQIAINSNAVVGEGRYGIMCYKLNPEDMARSVAVVGNAVAEITGALTDPSGGGIFGAGIYIQGFESCTVSCNALRRCNLNTTTELLAPGAIGTVNCRNVVIAANSVRETAWYGIYQNNANDAGEADGSSELTGNNIYACGKAGVLQYEFAASRISNNAVANCDVGVRVRLGPNSLAEDFTLATNRVTENTNQGVLIECGSATLVGNDVLRNGGSAVRLQGGGTFALVANRLASSGGFGLDVDSSVIDVTARDNIFASNVSGDVRANVPVRGLKDNLFDLATPRIVSAGGYYLDYALPLSSTPSVKNMDMGYLPTGASVSDFLDGYIGQEIIVRAAGAATIQHDGHAITLKGNTNAALVPGNIVKLLKRSADAWIETSRNF